MILKSTQLINVKSYYPDSTINFESDINIFVGPNAGGKSNLFEILQGVINTILLKHVTLQQNPAWNDINNPERNKPFKLDFDNVDQNNLKLHIFDKHFKHTTEPQTIYISLELTTEDVKQISYILSIRDIIIAKLEKDVVNSLPLTTLLKSIPIDIHFGDFVNKTVKLMVNSENSFTIMISDYAGYSPEQQARLNMLFELIQYRNVFHEISLISLTPDIHPASRYFGPHRTLNQVRDDINVDLSSAGNLEDNYAKDINQFTDNTRSFIDSSFNKLCYLFKSGNTHLLDRYKEYLSKYLKVNLNISQIEHPTKFLYRVNFTRQSGTPLRLSSGEKEFFNLISGLILSELKDGIVFIDEPELHLHFQWQQVILNLIKDLSQDFNIQFLIVTHSPKFINQETLPKIFRVYMGNELSSCIVKPENPLNGADAKDLIKLINTTNNEKAFFTQKVVLVEGVSDLIVYSNILHKLKDDAHSEIEIEVIEVASKGNLLKFRNLLTEWKIDNYIIADLGYLKDVRRDKEHMIHEEETKAKFVSLNDQINSLVLFSEEELKNILCRNPGEDANTIVNLIRDKETLGNDEFTKRLLTLCNYIRTQRAIKLNPHASFSIQLVELLTDLAEKEKILILREGNLEDLFKPLKTAGNKVTNAIRLTNGITLTDIPEYLKTYLRNILTA